MKSLELSLNKRLLIVEPPEGYSLVHFRNGQSKLGFVNLNIANPYDDVIDLEVDGKLDLICKVSDLTETNNAMKSFISAIESNGWYWGDNPLGKEPKLTDSKYNEEREFIDNNPDEMVFGDHYVDWSMWQEVESRTFNPSKCIIFEIL